LRFIILVVAALLAVNPIHAQDRATLTIPAKTPLTLAFTSEVSSKTAQKDSEILFVLVEDLVIDGQIIVPKGAKALGEVIHVQKSGFGGRGGELILAARYLEHNAQKITLRSLKPYTGLYVGKNNSNTALAVSMIPYAGLMSLFITGGEIVIPQGTPALALVASDTPIDPVPVEDHASVPQLPPPLPPSTKREL
jgi:hypothetical protein